MQGSSSTAGTPSLLPTPRSLQGLLGELEGLLGACEKRNLQVPGVGQAKSECVSFRPLLATWRYCMPSAGGYATGL